MHIHILGICGTFMGGVALLARALGHRVTGSDANVYPPMSTQLEAAGISLMEGYDPRHLRPAPDCVVIGNALSRGNPAVEEVLNRGLTYLSGPEWLARHLLPGRQVLAVAGTHGKTTTASMLAWILEHAGLSPGFLIGGVPLDFGVSASLGEGTPFVVEADEYDTAFFDKRSKFVHYLPRIAVLNNLEFDHADIFPDLAAIRRQFHHLVRTIPGEGRILVNGADAELERVLAMGCWTPVERFGLHGGGHGWEVEPLLADGSRFRLYRDGAPLGETEWALIGKHNLLNGVAAVSAAAAAGVEGAVALQALSRFHPPRRRLELRGEENGIAVYDDFAHHPTAIAATLEAMRMRIGDAPLVAVLEPRSNTMRLGVHADRLASALAAADRVELYVPPSLDWDPSAALAPMGERARAADDIDLLVRTLAEELSPGSHVVVMSNGAFGGIHQRLLDALRERGMAHA
ncbi:MAG TPA: UDP-N-acetylmuramate:L-alanyl-gamma-D-glutamyl-meso-diaminopimelate ligase [Thiotrichales bacterium]|nr:UDP-N-acetylmuramate:L-alanyl-gamma-D-glutamyl-meso-diaminopimelate ligase [Thiotrichales bacterium]